MGRVKVKKPCKEKKPNKMSKFKPEKVMDIDRNNLDLECVKLPKVYLVFGEAYAESLLHSDEADRDLKIIKAELDFKVRSKPKKYKLKARVTEKAIENAILTSKEYRKAEKVCIERRYTTSLLREILRSLEMKKKSLENLVILHGQNYFSTPTPKNVDKETVKDLRQKLIAGRTKKRKG